MTTIDFATFEQTFGVEADEFNTELSSVSVLEEGDVRQIRRTNRMGHDGKRMTALPVAPGYAQIEFVWPYESYKMASDIARVEAANMLIHPTFVAVSPDFGAGLMRYYFRPADPAA